jgi:hypothetical protein
MGGNNARIPLAASMPDCGGIHAPALGGGQNARYTETAASWRRIVGRVISSRGVQNQFVAGKAGIKVCTVVDCQW